MITMTELSKRLYNLKTVSEVNNAASFVDLTIDRNKGLYRIRDKDTFILIGNRKTLRDVIDLIIDRQIESRSVIARQIEFRNHTPH